ncbi:peptidase M14 [Mycena belliarum]|uniref:Inactive metallocarboxypeptidase ECM14 n=1 Tax=Mycena belliarum TaxID=1033014 RepID=A0AAD6XY35_9AGAR|nr:peptidase M14 [Mycena belliae]
MRSLLFSAFLALPCAAAALEQHAFDAHTSPPPGVLRRFFPSSLGRLEDVLDMAQAHDLDIWQIGAGDVPHVDIYSSPSSVPLPGVLLTTPHTLSNVSIPDRSLGLSDDDWGLDSLENSTFHAAYHPQAEVDEFIFALARAHPDFVKIVDLGHTSEGREMLGMKISAPVNGTAVQKLGFVVLGPQHAREWVATSTALYLAHALLADKDEPGSLSYLLDAFDFHIIPSPNPDGYIHTWEGDRFWYKNRQIVGPGAKCIGIDMNRNWGAHWKPHAKHPLFAPASGADSSVESHLDAAGGDDGELKRGKKRKNKLPADPCSHWYPGHRAFEAHEVTNVANYLTRVQGVGKGAKGPVAAFLELRSYGQMLAAPYSYKCDKLPKDAEDQMEALHGAAQAGRAAYGTPFATGTLCNLLYRAPGNLLDYVYTTTGVKYAYSAFLRDTGTYGFALPPAWIRPVGEETGGVVAYLAKFVARQRGIAL